MFYRRWVSGSLAVLLISQILLAPAYGEVEILLKGQQSPHDGLLLDEAASIAVAERMRDLKANEAIIEALKAELEGYSQQITNLEASNEAYKKASEKDIEARIREDERHKLMTEVEVKMEAAIKLNNQSIENFKVSAEMNLQALQSAQRHIEKLEKYRLWSLILGPIGFLAGIFVMR